MFLSVSPSGHVFGSAATETKPLPCQVVSKFTRDRDCRHFVNCRLFLQANSQEPQPVTHVSILWLDNDDEILGNNDTKYKAGNEPLEVGLKSHGSRTLRTIRNRLLQTFDNALWTDIVNFELKTFERIKSCSVMDYRYETG